VKYRQVQRVLGGAAKIAKSLSQNRKKPVKKQTVHQWKLRNRIPGNWQIELEPLTGLKADKAARAEAMRMAAYINGGTRK
jgi:hypothetical protein